MSGNLSDLNRVGGNTTLTDTVGPNTKMQLDAVAINSGILVPGGVNSTNAGPVKETRYEANDTIQPKGGQDRTVSISDSTYTDH